MSQFADRYLSRTRIGIMDAAASNMKSEREVLNARNDAHASWCGLCFRCEIHQTAACHRQTFALCADDLSGQINLALVLNTGTNMAILGEVIEEFVTTHIVLMRGEASPDAVRYRKSVLTLCTGRGGGALRRLACMDLLPNGDWRRSGCVEVFVANGISYDHGRVASVVGAALRQSLTSTQMTPHPRSRWAKGDEAWNQFLLLEGIHGLLSTVWPERVPRPTSRARLSQPSTDAGPAERTTPPRRRRVAALNIRGSKPAKRAHRPARGFHVGGAGEHR